MFRRRAPMIVTAVLGLLAAFLIFAVVQQKQEAAKAAYLRPAILSAAPIDGAAAMEHAAKLEGGLTFDPDLPADQQFPRTAEGDYIKVSFAALGSFPYSPPTSGKESGVPEWLRTLDGEPVALVGNMVPLSMAVDGSVEEFALTQDIDYCCYGTPPDLNELVIVQSPPGEKTKYYELEPLMVTGTLEVGEERGPDGSVMNIYRMQADAIEDPAEFQR